MVSGAAARDCPRDCGDMGGVGRGMGGSAPHRWHLVAAAPPG